MVVFPPRYASSPAGLVAPETELDCLMVVHEGQGIVEHLRAAIGEKSAEPGHGPAGRRQVGSNATPEPASCKDDQLG